jgi:ribosome maturation factor RimP
MEEKIKKIKEAITEPMNELSIIVDEIVYEKENGYNFLKITLDKVNGLDMDSIVEATNVINPIVDELDLIDEEYILDISSKERGN